MRRAATAEREARIRAQRARAAREHAAAVASAMGHDDDATDALRTALSRYKLKGATALAQRVETRLTGPARIGNGRPVD